MAQILIVDDEPSMCRILEEHLRRAGHTSASASNGLEALELLEAVPFDLVITDIIMPQMEGIETIRVLHKRFPGLKVIAMSGGGRYDSGEFYLGMAQSFGVAAVLSKPFSKEQLLQAVAHATGNSGASSSLETAPTS